MPNSIDYAIWIIRLVLWFAGSWYLPTILILNFARMYRYSPRTI